MLRHKRGFYCFSPPIMLATFAIEITFLIYALIRYKMNVLTRLISSMLFCLAIFQLAEYNVCGGMGANAATWSKVGFVAITMLPPLGIHLLHEIAGKPWNKLTAFSYATGLVWASTFVLSPNIFVGHSCAGNYAIFQIQSGAGGLYFTYYYFWLFVGTLLCYKFAQELMKKRRESLWLLMAGYLTLLVPTTLANMVNPATIEALPSVMCGFAIILAFILTFGILPRLGETVESVRSRIRF